MKKAFVWCHRWFGIVVGLYFALLGITGSVLVYGDAVDEMINPNLYISAHSSAHPQSLGALIKSAQEALQTDKLPRSVVIPESAYGNAVLTFDIPSGKERRRVKAFVDLTTNEFKGSYNFATSFVGFIFRFHHDLFMGGTGKTIAAVGAIFMMLILISGIYLWWPKNGQFKRAFTMRPLKSFFIKNYELHRLTGIYTAGLLLMSTFTGLVIARPDWFGAGKPRQAIEQKEAKPLFDFNKIDESLRSADLLQRPMTAMIDVRKGTVKVADRQMNIDDYVLSPPTEQKVSFRNYNFNLHSGKFWGEIGQLVMFLAGLLPLAFYFSGIYIWLKKSKPAMKRVR
ncbi:PepSY domain-containing protein [Bdellovibrio sp. SKB1291214]|uniref:PepSY-associated TM helix domain-containing protein n=1 Tax=Bdellovibrio sp. SKB1291214 TaxID=1732569 RepID=UPI000B6DF6D7|nr:PepSY-associated TM helix domain-containing protein [Bdellovibrio sp. SKB1291214]UYL09302.1 PepSY domain-containing protein [Bdellovibrio sp. SKB1291214]